MSEDIARGTAGTLTAQLLDCIDAINRLVPRLAEHGLFLSIQTDSPMMRECRSATSPRLVTAQLHYDKTASIAP